MKKIYPLLATVIIIVAAVFLIYKNKETTNSENDNVNNINTENIALTDFTAQEIGVKISYPGNWQRFYSPPTIFGFALELSSDIQTSDINPETNQQLTGSLIKISIYRQENFENVSLSEWISKNTSVVDEQERIRKDNDGWFGIRQWIWHKSNQYAFSTISYYIQKDNDFWEFRADINENDPESTQFKEAVEIVDRVFNSISFFEPRFPSEDENSDSIQDLGNGFSAKIPSGWGLNGVMTDVINIVKFGSPAQTTILHYKDIKEKIYVLAINIQTFTIDERLAAKDILNLFNDEKIADKITNGTDKCYSNGQDATVAGMNAYSYVYDVTNFEICNIATESSISKNIVVKNTGDQNTLMLTLVARNRNELNTLLPDFQKVIDSVQYKK